MNKLKFYRTNNSITQTQMAEMLDIRVSTYNQYEMGKRTVPSDKAIEMAKILKCKVNDIFLPSKFTVSEQ